jgi:hypothetical protein
MTPIIAGFIINTFLLKIDKNNIPFREFLKGISWWTTSPLGDRDENKNALDMKKGCRV